MNGMLQGKVALVTAGSQGIGRQLAIALAGAGTKIGLVYKTDEAGGEMVETSGRLIERELRGALAKMLEGEE